MTNPGLDNTSVYILSQGICAMSVCVPKDMEREQIQNAANIKSPTGISSRWKIADDEKFSGGEDNPCPCQDNPESRMHYLLNC